MQPELATAQRPGEGHRPTGPSPGPLPPGGWGHIATACLPGPSPRNFTVCSVGLPVPVLFLSHQKKPSTFFDQRSRKATAKSRQINFIDISIFTAMRYPPSHGRDDPHYLQTDRPLHYNHPAPRQSSSPPSAQTLEHDPEVAVLFFFAVCYD